MISIEIIYQEVINLSFGLPFRLYLNILETKKILQFWDKRILDVRGTSFQRVRTCLHRDYHFVSKNESRDKETSSKSYVRLGVVFTASIEKKGDRLEAVDQAPPGIHAKKSKRI